MHTQSKQFQYIQEWSEEFLSLWPHRYDYIWAEHPQHGQRPEWKTESRHPLSDRLIRQGSYLYGVRFGAQTNYCLLDIDAGSPYHPKHDPLAIGRILAALEPLGLVTHLACTSSYSGGIHLYLPFQSAQKSWQLALVVQTLIENAGFKVALGQLEILPNPKVYATDHTPSLYAAHRLPMQAGSYLLNSHWEVIWSDSSSFVRQWNLVQSRNDIDELTLEQILQAARRKQYRISGKGEKFLNDLNAEIEVGWTGDGQTNYLLGRIAMRSYIFGHLLNAAFPLEGQTLVNDIVTVASSLPGYQDYCGHQHEIEKRAEEWARCVENSHYYHYGSSKFKSTTTLLSPVEPQPPTWNQRQSQEARDRIRSAIADMLNQGTLPADAGKRHQALTKYGIGGETLYKHKDLWHPGCLWITPPDPPNSEELSCPAAFEGPTEAEEVTSLLDRNGSKDTTGKDLEPSELSPVEPKGSNDKDVKASRESDPFKEPKNEEVTQLKLELQGTLGQIKAQIQAQKEANQAERSHQLQAQLEARRTAQAEKMRRYLESGDRILVEEAMRWMQANPEILDTL
ncbi:MAG: hypothetical protein SFW36_13320 [Leptolyngbyaceae cyanobacterium bins.59]|nr:hypothetical protein [Leptolyngbyaceae cyanobacterium bins.59]